MEELHYDKPGIVNQEAVVQLNPEVFLLAGWNYDGQHDPKQMEEELFDGILLNLRCKNKVKSYNAQKRILRRIVEKRQAQQAYSKVGRRRDRFSSHIYRHCTSKSMSELRDHQLCA